MKMPKSEWGIWIRCNILEIIILILVLMLVINVFSKGTTTQIQEKDAKQVSAIKEQASEPQKISDAKEIEKPLEEKAIQNVTLLP